MRARQRLRAVIAACATALAMGACGAQTPANVPGDAATTTDARGDVADASACLGGPRRAPGGPCRCTADCEPGATCATEEETGLPGGMCLQPCDPAEAPRPGLSCRTLDGGNAYFPACGPNGTSPCRDAWYCRVYVGSNRARDVFQCEPACSRDAQCRTGRCNRYSGFCEAVGEGAPNGAPCSSSKQCRGGVCFASGEGACTSLCDTRTGFCPDDGYCLPPVQADAGAHNGTCLPRCARLADCRRGLTCMRAMGQGVCVPDRL